MKKDRTTALTLLLILAGLLFSLDMIAKFVTSP